MGPILRNSLSLRCLLTIRKHYAWLIQGRAHHPVFHLIGREFGGNYNVRNLSLCHVAILESKWNLFDPGLAYWLAFVPDWEGVT
jgi:hypothetical protein